jgi:hypothetical protein
LSTAPTWPRDLGTSTVCDALGLSSLEQLDPHPSLITVGRNLRRSAHRLDSVHAQLVQLARSASQDLQRIAAGVDDLATSTHGALGHTALKIELLAARRAEMLEQLPILTDAYRRLAEARKSERTAGADRRSAALATTSGPTPVRLSPAQEAAVLAIGSGEVMVMGAFRSGKVSVASPGPDRITMPTVTSLERLKLVHWDRRTSLIAGQQLSLTTEGESRRAAILSDRHQPHTDPRTAVVVTANPPR